MFILDGNTTHEKCRVDMMENEVHYSTFLRLMLKYCLYINFIKN